MPKTFRPWDVDQSWLLPPSAHELVPPGHLAHFVRDTVRVALDLSAVLAAFGEERGYTSYRHPLAQIARTGWYCEVAVKSVDRQAVRSLFTSRAQHAPASSPPRASSGSALAPTVSRSLQSQTQDGRPAGDHAVRRATP